MRIKTIDQDEWRYAKLRDGDDANDDTLPLEHEHNYSE